MVLSIQPLKAFDVVTSNIVSEALLSYYRDI